MLYRNAEDAKRNEDESGERLLWHIHTRLQEELEKKAEPGLALSRALGATRCREFVSVNKVPSEARCIDECTTV